MVPIHTAGLCPDVRTDLEPQISVDTTVVHFSKFAYHLNFVLLNNSFPSSQQTHCDSIIKKKHLMVFFGGGGNTWFILKIIMTYKGRSSGAFAKQMATVSLATSVLPSVRLESNVHQKYFRKI